MYAAMVILLRHIGCGTIEVEPASADLKADHYSKTWWNEGVNRVICEACKKQVLFVEFVISPSIVGVAEPGLVRANRKK
jgi:hypothetical protein